MFNIQSVGAPVTTKTGDRTVSSVAQPGATTAVGDKSTAAQGEPSRADVSDAVKKINDSIGISNQSIEFSIDEDSKDIVVKVIDQDTKEVVRQMPSKEALQIAKSLDKMRGLLIDQTA